MFTNRDEWRAWLEANHDQASEVWLAYYKKDSGKPSVTYDEAVEEAICFGWIDGKVRTIDAERYMQRFTQRKKGGTWSESNKERVARMIEQGRMTQAGMAAVRAARDGGSWDTLTPVDNLEVPPDLEAALAANQQAGDMFNRLSPSDRKQFLWWVISAKTPETRKKRIKMTVKRVAQGKKPG